MDDVAGVTNLKVEPQMLVPQLDVRLRPEAAAPARPDARRRPPRGDHAGQAGPRSARSTTTRRSSTSSSGASSGCATTSRSCSSLPIETPLGTHVPLGDVADVAIVPAPNEIKREGASRRIDVTCNVRGATWAASPARSRRKVRELDFAREYHPEFLGEYAAREESRRRLLALAALSLLGILLIIHADFRTVRLTRPGLPDACPSP